MTIEELKVIIRAETADIKKKTEDLKKSLVGVKKQAERVTQSTKSMDKAHKEAEKATRSHNKEVKKIGQELSRSLKQFDRQKEAINRCKLAVARSGAAYDKLKSKMDAQKTSLAGQNAKVAQMEQTYQRLSKAMNQHGSYDEMQATEGNLTKQMSDLIQQRHSLEESTKYMRESGSKTTLTSEGTMNKNQLAAAMKRNSLATEELREKLYSVRDAIEQVQNAGMKKLDDSSLRRLGHEVDKARQKLRDMDMALRDTGRRMDIAGQKSAESSGKLAQMKGAAADTGERIGKLKKELKGLSGIKGTLGGIKEKLQGIGNGAKKATSGMKGAKKEANALARGLNFLAMTFKFTIAYMAVMSVMQGAAEGFKNLSQYSSKTNRDLSQLMSVLTQLKNSFAAAFAPVLSIVGPILSKLIGWLSSAMNALAHFFAALTGQSKVVVAKKVNQDFASSIEGTGDAADEANKKAEKYKRTLMGFDQINKLDAPEKKTDTGSGELSPSDMFETVEVDNKYKALADKVKSYFTDIFAPVKYAWNTYGQSVMDAWKGALNSVWAAVKDIGKSFLEVWTNGTGYTFCSNILLLVRDIGEAVKGFATAFRNAWNEGGRGTALIQSLFDLWNGVLSLIHQVNKSFLSVWNNGTGEKIIGHLLDIWTNINNTIKNIAQNLKKAWSENDLGTKIIQGLADIFENLLGHIKNITSNLEKWSKGLNFEPILKAFNGLVQALKPLGDKLGAGLEWLFKNILQPLGKWAIEQAIPAALDAISGAFKIINGVLDILKPVAKWIWEHFLAPLAKFTGGAIVTVLHGIGDAFNFVADIISDPKKYVAKIKAKFADTKEKIKEKWDNIVSGVKDKKAELKAKVETKANDVKKWWEETTQGWKDKATGLVANVKTRAEKVRSDWGLVTKWWKDKATSLKAKVNTKGSEINKNWKSVTKWWKDKKASLKMSVLAKASGVKETVNSIVSKINRNVIAKIKLRVPSSWPIIGGLQIGPPPYIRQFAKGGFPEEGPFMMNRGEIAGKFSNGKGVVANNQQITDGIANAVGPAVYQAVLSAMSAKSDGGGNVTVTLEGDAKKLFKAIKTEAQKYTNSTGLSPFPV